MAGTLSASPVPPAPCLALKGQLVSLQTQHKKLVLSYEATPSAKNQKLAAEIMVLDKKISETAAQLDSCENGPPLSVAAFTAKGIRSPDPQIAVGHKYFAAIDTSTVVFYDKATMQPLSTGFAYPQNPIGVSQLFQQFFVKLDKQMGLPANVCDSNQPQKNLTNTFDPAQPNKAIPGCIAEAYDTRILYDDVRHRFWIESAVRNSLWPCGAGAETETSSDPDPSDPTQAKCHADWNASWAHRFIVIAVSQVDDKGEEDLSKPFHQYVLVDDYADWPQMTVDSNYLIVPPLATLAYSQFQAIEGATPIQPTDSIYLVNSHGASNHPTYMVSSNGNRLLIFALRPSANIFGKPVLLKGAGINLGHLVHLRTNPVFRDGKIHIASFECTHQDAKKGCTKYISRIIRVLVSLTIDGSAIKALGPGSSGFLDYAIGNGPGDLWSYEIPSIEVNAANDIVVVYERAGRDQTQLEPTSVLYSVLYNGESVISAGAFLKVYAGAEIPLDPALPAVVDLGGIALDPSDNGLTVWMSHAYSNQGLYREVLGAVKP
ncbi:MAG: hypothetical protein LAO78_24165 [Acidobacteriia bacterium]|nr:hypothetical protein [Terriglobia bacterium]